MANPGDFAYTVKQQADIVRVIGEYVKLRKAGAQNFSGLCPFHNEKTPSFSVHATRQFFHCFGCGASGDVFSFVQKLENITFPEAVRAVAQKFGIPLPKTTFSSPAEAQEARLRTVLMEVHERASDFFREQLRRPEGARAREYLAGRGLNDEMIARFRIGFAPDSGFILRDLLKSTYDEETLRASGLFAWKQDDSGPPPATVALAEPSPLSTPAEKSDAAEAAADTRADEKTVEKISNTRPDRGKAAIYSRFRNRVMFPITSETGKVIAFTGRTLATDEKSGPKYLNSPETPIYSKSRVLFNLDLAKEAMRKLDYAILVEGQMDCISVYAAGFHNVMASSGTAFTELQARLLGRFTKNVVVNFDPDTAGAKATERTLGLLVEEEFQIKVLTLEPGFDPDLYIRRKGKDAYAQTLKNSQRYFDYLIERARSQFGARSAESKVKAVNYLLPHIQRVPSRIVRDELAQEIAHKLQIDSAILRQELRHTASNRATKAVKSPPTAQVTDSERILIRALASAPEMSHGRHISSREGTEGEFDPARQAQFALRHELLHEGLASESLMLALLEGVSQGVHAMDLPLSESDRSTLAAILIREGDELTPETLERAVTGLRWMTVRRRLQAVQREFEEAVRQNDPSHLAELSAEKVRLKRLLGDPAVVENAGAA